MASERTDYEQTGRPPCISPLPSSLQVVPGTERAQAAYPYTVQFGEGDDNRFWFYNSMHFPEPMSAFDMVTAEAAYCALGSSNTRVHCLPHNPWVSIIGSSTGASTSAVTPSPTRQKSPAARRNSKKRGVLLLRELGATVRTVARKDDEAHSGCAGIAETRVARV